MANDLKLGCDCLGSIHYLSAVLNDDKGEPMHMPNVVCIHEQDGGIGWKRKQSDAKLGMYVRY
jgi:primary-amine oxidase